MSKELTVEELAEEAVFTERLSIDDLKTLESLKLVQPNSGWDSKKFFNMMLKPKIDAEQAEARQSIINNMQVERLEESDAEIESLVKQMNEINKTDKWTVEYYKKLMSK